MDSELAALAEKNTRDLDLTDAPELPAGKWKNPIHGMDDWLKAARTRS